MDLLLALIFIINFLQIIIVDYLPSMFWQNYTFDMANMSTALMLAIYAFRRTSYINLKRKSLLYLIILMQVWYIIDYTLINIFDGSDYIYIARTITSLVSVIVFMPLVIYQYRRKWPKQVHTFMKREGRLSSTKSQRTL